MNQRAAPAPVVVSSAAPRSGRRAAFWAPGRVLGAGTGFARRDGVCGPPDPREARICARDGFACLPGVSRPSISRSRPTPRARPDSACRPGSACPTRFRVPDPAPRARPRPAGPTRFRPPDRTSRGRPRGVRPTGLCAPPDRRRNRVSARKPAAGRSSDAQPSSAFTAAATRPPSARPAAAAPARFMTCPICRGPGRSPSSVAVSSTAVRAMAASSSSESRVGR